MTKIISGILLLILLGSCQTREEKDLTIWKNKEDSLGRQFEKYHVLSRLEQDSCKTAIADKDKKRAEIYLDKSKLYLQLMIITNDEMKQLRNQLDN